MSKRIVYLIVIVLLGIFSLTVSGFVGVFPPFILSYAPSFIWASIIYMVYALILEKGPVIHFVSAILTISAVAVAMNFKVPAIADFYSTEIGKTLLGAGFEIPMIVCYITGLMFCFIIDYILDSVKRR